MVLVLLLSVNTLELLVVADLEADLVFVPLTFVPVVLLVALVPLFCATEVVVLLVPAVVAETGVVLPLTERDTDEPVAVLLPYRRLSEFT